MDVVLSSSRDATFGSMIFNFTLFFILFQLYFFSSLSYSLEVGFLQGKNL